MAKKRNRIKILNLQGDYFDYNLLAVIILLTCFGLVMLYSTSAYVAELKFKGDDMYYFRKQALVSAGCIIGAILISFLDYHVLYKCAGIIYIVSVILMMLVQSPLGVTAKGARRWLKIGIQFQPSEIAKIAMIVAIPALIVKLGNMYKGLKPVIIGLSMAFGLFLCAWQFTDNLSTAIIIFGIACLILFVAHPKTRPFLIVAAIGAILVVVLVFVLQASMEDSKNFRIQRVLVWLDPEKYSEEGGYQILQALYALGSGGFFGKGLGNSTQKLGPVPEAQNDMIFSIICEELGIFGGAIVLLLFGYLIYRLFFIARNASDLFGSLMVTGIMAHISLQVILNICVVINLIPTTGVTLPFVSYGGTSVLFLMAEMAIAMSVSRGIRFQKDKHRQS